MTKIQIKDFQSIKKAEFAVDGFTVIVGKNNIGKSAIIRAVDAALTNQAGNEFIRRGEKRTEVLLKREGLDVLWKKGSTATYKVNGESFSKLNRSVPPPLLEAGFKKIEIGDQKLSPIVATQFEPLFLLDRTGSAVTEVLSSMYKLDIISRADDLCQKEARSIKSLLKTREADKKTAESELEKYKDFESIKKDVSKIKTLDDNRKKLEAEIEYINSALEKLETSTRMIKVLKPIIGMPIPSHKEHQTILTEVEWLETKISEVESAKAAATSLSVVPKIRIPKTGEIETSIKEVKEIEEYSDNLKSLLGQMKGHRESLRILAPVLSEIDVNGIGKMCEEFEHIGNLEKDFSYTAKSARETRDELKKASEELQTKKDEKDAVMKEMKICPMCERPL